jgi:hypothetical protein
MDTKPLPRNGLPAQLESQVYELLLNLMREYLALQKSHMRFDRINGIISHAHTRAMREVFEEIKPRPEECKPPRKDP